MGLMHEVSEIERSLKTLKREANIQQAIYFRLIQGMVKMHQKHRVAKDFAVSDEIRDLLNSLGVSITQGTDGLTYEEIKKRYAKKPQPPVGDTWDLDLKKTAKILDAEAKEKEAREKAEKEAAEKRQAEKEKNDQSRTN